MKTRIDADAAAFLDDESSDEIQRFGEKIAGKSKPSVFQRIKTHLKNSLVQDLPDEMLVCEYCGETQCTQERWETCSRRLDSIHGLPRD